VNTDSFDAFIARATRPARHSLVPEVVLNVADDLPALWSAKEDWTGKAGSSAPYWGIAWPGGLTLARLLLDDTHRVRGKRVLDVGSGSGLCAIAASLAGARSVVAADIDPDACEAICRNAALNGVRIEVTCEDPIGTVPSADVVLAADLWYERFFARKVTHWLRDLTQAGHEVLMADPGRSHAPRKDVVEIVRHEFVPAKGLEQGTSVAASAFRFHLQQACIRRAPARE
jgi:predicted nicotinamide N-methyase